MEVCDVEDDGYWKDVEQAYKDFIREGVDRYPPEELWEMAKHRARTRYRLEIAMDKVNSGEKTLDQAFADHYFLEHDEDKIN
jgi:hypothetical protein